MYSSGGLGLRNPNVGTSSTTPMMRNGSVPTNSVVRPTADSPGQQALASVRLIAATLAELKTQPDRMAALEGLGQSGDGSSA
jgi:hypothetical protein